VIDRLLERLDVHGVRGTFFVLGWLARREPQMVRAIADAGHEIASHGWNHKKVGTEDVEAFRRSVRESKEELEQLSGERVEGFRAPSFSIGPGREWAFDILIEEGYSYDSSVFPVYHPSYGDPDAPRDPYQVTREGGALFEVPPCTLRLLGKNFAAAGGAYFRFFPYSFIRAAFRQAARRKVPGTFYLHPWELDPDQPQLVVPPRVRLRTYAGGRRSWPRLDRFLDEFEFIPIRETLP